MIDLSYIVDQQIVAATRLALIIVSSINTFLECAVIFLFVLLTCKSKGVQVCVSVRLCVFISFCT